MPGVTRSSAPWSTSSKKELKGEAEGQGAQGPVTYRQQAQLCLTGHLLDLGQVRKHRNNFQNVIPLQFANRLRALLYLVLYADRPNQVAHNLV